MYSTNHVAVWTKALRNILKLHVLEFYKFSKIKMQYVSGIYTYYHNNVLFDCVFVCVWVSVCVWAKQLFKLALPFSSIWSRIVLMKQGYWMLTWKLNQLQWNSLMNILLMHPSDKKKISVVKVYGLILYFFPLTVHIHTCSALHFFKLQVLWNH